MTVDTADPLVAALLGGQNADGGWPPTKGGGSNTEVTALAVMALSARAEASMADAAAAGRRWLASHQGADGGWSSTASVDESSWMTAPAVLALAGDASGRPAAIRGGQWLLDREGRGLPWFVRLWQWLYPPREPPALDTELKGWPWSAGTFSWVEPTAYSLLALKRLGSYLPSTRARTRIEQGERLIYDRMCPGGGWNYGNTRTLGESLAPYADTTALALIAIHDRAARDRVEESLHVLERLKRDARRGLAVGWAALCFDLYGMPSTTWQTRLREQYSDTRFLGKTKPLALAVLALSRGAGMFRA